VRRRAPPPGRTECRASRLEPRRGRQLRLRRPRSWCVRSRRT
jgi:hypothetical protein